MKRLFSGIMLVLLVVSMSTGALSIQPVKAEPGTIYIRNDGSVDRQQLQYSGMARFTLSRTTFMKK